MVERDQRVVLGSLLLGAAVLLGLVTWRRRRTSRHRLPANIRWRPIGTLKNLLIFPMKSGGNVEVEQADCTEMGLAQVSTPGLYSLRDRNFIVYRTDTKEMVTCMTYPIMISIKILPLAENSVLLKSRDKANLEVLIPSQRDTSKDKAEMWTKEIMPFFDCGDEAADWITEVIKGDKNVDGKLRLGYWATPEGWQDGIDQRYTDRGAFQNYTSYMLMSTSSIQELSGRLPEHPLTYKQFRPNFLVDTDKEPFSEDNWTWVRIGEKTVFRKIKDCSRCTQVNIDPETCKFNRKQEPLSALKKYRQKNEKSGPTMGICMGLYRAGNVKVGDTVYIPV